MLCFKHYIYFMFALVDCNNFYASCERVFNPSLQHKPIVILSNNDGCVIARSQEAKDLGIKMGEPFFQKREFMDEHRFCVYSSNYNLYGDMSDRVMTVIKKYANEVEVYSIDECFVDFSNIPAHNREHFELGSEKGLKHQVPVIFLALLFRKATIHWNLIQSN